MLQSDGTGLLFIISLPRSGSTLLGTLLDKLPALHCPPEPWVVTSLIAQYSGNIGSAFLNESGERARDDFFKTEFPYESAREFVISAYNKKLSENKKSHFVDKTPRNVLFPDILPKLFPKATYIVLLRNPLDVAVSFQEAWGVSPEILAGLDLRPETADWLVGLPALVEWCQQDIEKRILLTYEKLVEDPNDQIRKLAESLAIPAPGELTFDKVSQKMLEAHRASPVGDKKILATKKVHQNSVGRWKSAFSVNQLGMLVNSVGTDVFESLGYLEVIDYLRGHGVNPSARPTAKMGRDQFAQNWVKAIESKVIKADEKIRELLSTLAEFTQSHEELKKVAATREQLLAEASTRESHLHTNVESLQQQLLHVLKTSGSPSESLSSTESEETIREARNQIEILSQQCLEFERLAEEKQNGEALERKLRIASETEYTQKIATLAEELEGNKRVNRADFETRQALEATVHELESTRANLQALVSEKTTQFESARLTLQQHIDRLNAEVDRMAHTVGEQNDYIETLQRQLARSVEQKAQADATAGVALQALKSDAERRQMEQENRIAELDHLLQSRTFEFENSEKLLGAQVVQLNDEVARLGALCSEQRNNIATLENQHQQVLQDKNALERRTAIELDKIRSESTLREENQAKRIAGLESEIERIRKDEEQSRDVLQSHIDRLNEDAHRFAAVIENQLAYIRSLEEQRAGLEAAKRQLCEEEATLKQSLEEREVRLGVLETAAAEQTQILAEKSQMLMEAESAGRKLQAELTEEKGRVSDLLQALRATEERLAQSNNSLAGKVSELELSKEELASEKERFHLLLAQKESSEKRQAALLEEQRLTAQKLDENIKALNRLVAEQNVNLAQAEQRIVVLGQRISAHNTMLRDFHTRRRVHLLNKSGVLPIIPELPEAET